MNTGIMEQSELDALIAQAGALAAEANTLEAEELAEAEVAAAPPAVSTPAAGPDLRRILRLRVPVIVQLARRTMPIVTVRTLAVGAIIEFDKSVEEPLDLLINNRLIGRGNCVKVGENFGLRVNEICDQAERIRSMGAG